MVNNIKKKKPRTYDIENPDPGLGQAQKCGGFKPVNGVQPSPSWSILTSYSLI